MSLQLPQLSQLRDGALSSIDKLLGRQPPTWSQSLSTSAWNTYGSALSQLGFVLSLPMTVLSFLAIPFFGGTSTSINLLFFYLTWSALIWTHSPRAIEIYGTLAVRLITFLLPSLGFLAFDYFVPGAAASIKAGGKRQLPSRLGQTRLLRMSGWATFNVLLGIALQAVLDLSLPLFGFRPALRVSIAVPLPWTMARQLLFAFFLRGTLHYTIHRFVLHAPRSTRYPVFKCLTHLHRTWAHSTSLVFSLTATYDHPVCFLLAQWLPTYASAAFMRLHVLTFLAFVALTSLEDLFVHSGYSALPSAIMLPGMARRVERHYQTGGRGNFGHWGVLDFLCRTTAGGEGDSGEDRDVVDDLRDEADKHQVRRRVSDAVGDAGSLLSDAKDTIRNRRRQRFESGGNDEDDGDASYHEESGDEAVEESTKPKKNGVALPTKRRTRRG